MEIRLPKEQNQYCSTVTLHAACNAESVPFPCRGWAWASSSFHKSEDVRSSLAVAIAIAFYTVEVGVSNHWTRMRTGMMEWTMEWMMNLHSYNQCSNQAEISRLLPHCGGFMLLTSFFFLIQQGSIGKLTVSLLVLHIACSGITLSFCSHLLQVCIGRTLLYVFRFINWPLHSLVQISLDPTTYYRVQVQLVSNANIISVMLRSQ